MKVTICDRCGSRLDRETGHYVIKMWPVYGNMFRDNRPDRYTEKDLCGKCFQGVLDALSPSGKGVRVDKYSFDVRLV